MPDQPLRPFAPPTGIAVHLPAAFSPALAVEWILYAMFATWALYTLVTIYHWLRYSNTSFLAFPAIAVHLAISSALISYALSGNALFLSGLL